MIQKQYWNGVYKNRIAILGIYPPPLGGVSTHIERVIECFLDQKNIPFFWNTETKMRRFFPIYLVALGWWLIKKRPHYLYYHSTYLSTSIIELIFIVSMRMIMRYQLHIVDHDCRHLYRRSQLLRHVYRTLIKYSDSVICMGKSIEESYKAHNITNSPIVQNPFIPPNIEKKQSIIKSYPASLKLFMRTHTPLLLMSAAHLMQIDNNDMYGIDTALYLIADIKNEFPKSGLILGLAEITDVFYFELLQKLARHLKITQNVYILHPNKQIWPLLEYSDIFIRPTLTDGDSISVREALYFGVPVIASDVCPRPKGVFCFKTNNRNNISSLAKKIIREQIYEVNRKHHHLHA